MIAVRAAFVVERLEGVAQVVERGVVVEIALHEAETLREALPHLLAEARAGVFPHGVVHDRPEVLVGPVASGETDESERRGGSRPRLARS